MLERPLPLELGIEPFHRDSQIGWGTAGFCFCAF